MRDRGMTHQQIADEVYRRTGHTVARSSVSVALKRAGAAQEKQRYEDTVPWTPVANRFQQEYPLRMLRLLGRARYGQPMSDDERHRLTSWLQARRDTDTIVVFCPDVPAEEPGFHYVPSEAKDHDDPSLPIRKEPVLPEAIGYPIRQREDGSARG